MAINPTVSPRRTFVAFDWLRIVAITMVAVHHALTTCNLSSTWQNINLGQVGVGIFCAISGFLALRFANSDDEAWLRRRLIKVFVPYWLSLPPLFLANAWFAYHPAGIDLIIAEFLGIGLFTHRHELVGDHVWFISLIVVCYFLAYLTRRNRAFFPLAIVAALAFMPWFPRVGGHLLAFTGGAMLGCLATNGTRLVVAAVMVGALAIGMSTTGRPVLWYPIIALALIAPLSIVVGEQSPKLAMISDATYEFYLVNTPLYLLLARFGEQGFWTTLIVGTALSIVATILLRGISAPLIRRLQPNARAPREIAVVS
jgi:peptidoglycan/LPS O-acetylase OafA/YrhL